MESLKALVEAELEQPVDPRVQDFARAIAGRHGSASQAVLFYGSCLRQSALDGLMLDFYLIVSDYRRAYDRAWLAVANRLIPPNVFYAEASGLKAKYAVLSQGDFHRLAGSGTDNVSVWARFAQPARIVWAKDKEARKAVVESVAQSAPTLLASAGEVAGEAPLDWWRRAFARTYSAELRAERKGREAGVVDSDQARYQRFSSPAIAAARALRGKVRTGWRWRRIKGKAWSVARLAKASLTFAGGPDYLAWKINRHAGTEISLKPWQRRHPLLAAISLLPKLLRSGAIR